MPYLHFQISRVGDEKLCPEALICDLLGVVITLTGIISKKVLKITQNLGYKSFNHITKLPIAEAKKSKTCPSNTAFFTVLAAYMVEGCIGWMPCQGVLESENIIQ
eukprot:11696328-Ditylum_brightwellii.AAC.1